jgi:hypothetical protein
MNNEILLEMNTIVNISDIKTPIIHSLIDSKEKLLRAVFFADMRKILPIVEEKLNTPSITTDNISVWAETYLRIAVQQNYSHLSHLFLALHNPKPEKSPNNHHFQLLLGCIYYNKPKLFKYLLGSLKTNEFTVRQIMQFYWLTLHLKQLGFLSILLNKDILPLPGVIRLAYLYEISLPDMNSLWQSIDDSQKIQALDLVMQHASPSQKIDDLNLPIAIKGWAKEPRRRLEIKEISSIQMPIVSPSHYPLTAEDIDSLAENQDYTKIMIEVPGDFFQNIYKKIKAYVFDNDPDKAKLQHILEWTDCLYGHPLTAAQTFLQDSDFQHAPDVLNFCLSLYNSQRQYGLTTQLLADSFLENMKLEMPTFRALRYFTGTSEQDVKDMKGISATTWQGSEPLEGDRVSVNQFLQPLTQQDSFGDLTLEIAARLGMHKEKTYMLPILPIPLPSACQQIIMEYLLPGQKKKIQKKYPGLNPQALLYRQIESLHKHLAENEQIVFHLQILLRPSEIAKRWFMKNLRHIAGGSISIASIISLSFNVISVRARNASLIHQPAWQDCMNRGYHTRSSIFSGQTCDKTNIPQPSIPECDSLCDELRNSSPGLLVWLTISILLIVAPLWIYVIQKCMERFGCRRRETNNIVSDDLNTRIDQFYLEFNENPPIRPQNRSSTGVNILITDLTGRRTELKASLDKLEKKSTTSHVVSIVEEKEISNKEAKESHTSDFFKSKKSKNSSLTTPLIGSGKLISGLEIASI